MEQRIRNRGMHFLVYLINSLFGAWMLSGVILFIVAFPLEIKFLTASILYVMFLILLIGCAIYYIIHNSPLIVSHFGRRIGESNWKLLIYYSIVAVVFYIICKLPMGIAHCMFVFRDYLLFSVLLLILNIALNPYIVKYYPQCVYQNNRIINFIVNLVEAIPALIFCYALYKGWNGYLTFVGILPYISYTFINSRLFRFSETIPFLNNMIGMILLSIIMVFMTVCWTDPTYNTITSYSLRNYPFFSLGIASTIFLITGWIQLRPPTNRNV